MRFSGKIGHIVSISIFAYIDNYYQIINSDFMAQY